MEREGKSDPIPIDIILDILSRLSTNSIAKFGLASKFCGSILRGQDFTELFLITRPLSRPRLLFAVQNSDKWCLYSSPQSQFPDENHSLVVSADFHMELRRDMGQEIFGLVSGLLYFPNTRTGEVPVICNPSTGQYARLTQRSSMNNLSSLLGYDPIGKKYKVITPSSSHFDPENILTLGTGKVAWRSIRCLVDHYPESEGICINGVLYYMASNKFQFSGVKIASFNVRYETLKFLNADVDVTFCPALAKLINYKGKLCVLSCLWDNQIYPKPLRWKVLMLWLWVLEDAEKEEWLKREYTLPVNIVHGNVSVVGVTATGEIILSMDYTSESFFVYYFNPERNTLEKVEIQGFEGSEKNLSSRVYTFVDYAEDVKFI
ncbi:putative F-box protein [Arabidopsis thaliana]|uniref:F-box associated domain type 3 n=2 Tax=Arabidopsis TaxID=3701 RepID=A0A8T2D6V1_9BRAS|nr:F-box associated domain type 3 [Arabidopsis thaliana x Arabidopsis arenosa]OAO94942.1 hypothetical protein AXX17_AT5G51500 [Arabidopsis thaliana]CAD5334711.1 unnamed protein product [Arabidopsis thaliana]VYS70133.1 unnamed protein product [Arabidopsis thaliana]